MAEKFIQSVTPKNSMEPRNDMRYVRQLIPAHFIMGDKSHILGKMEKVRIEEIQFVEGRMVRDRKEPTKDYYVGLDDEGKELFRYWADSVNVAYEYREWLEDEDAPFSLEICTQLMDNLPIDILTYKNPKEYISADGKIGWEEGLVKYLVEEKKLQHIEIRVSNNGLGGPLAPPSRLVKQFIKRELIHNCETRNNHNRQWLESIKKE